MEGKPGAVLITGATCGIGAALAREFAQDGFNLVLVARDGKRLADLADELTRRFSIQADIVIKDLAVPGAAQEIFVDLQGKMIDVDILVNNAGFNEYGSFVETDLEKELQMINLHIANLTALTKMFIPAMVGRKNGRVLNVGSTGSFAPGPFNAVYCATKAYILSFSEALAEELRGSGVTVTALCPGATRTEFAHRAKMEDIRIFRGEMMDAQKVARAGYEATRQGKTSVVPGLANRMTIASLRLMPRKMVARVAKRMLSRI